jgi:hypothetical protein
MWKEAVMAYFKVVSWHVYEGAEEYHEKTSVSIAGLLAKT